VETTSEVLRVEIQLWQKALKHVLNTGGGFPLALDFQECYQAFRSKLLKFAPAREVMPSPQSKAEALALLDQPGGEVEGRTPSEWFTKHMTPQTRRK